MKNAPVAVIAPHPDDETLGCGGTLLKYKAAGSSLHWIIVTAMTDEYSEAQRRERDRTLDEVAAAYGFASVAKLGFPTARLDTLPLGDLVGALSPVLKKIEPAVVFLPTRADVHSDHRVVFDAATACLKSFRLPSLRRALAYETPSETEQGLDRSNRFSPDEFVGVDKQLSAKLGILKKYASELGEFPFPRSLEAVKALAAVRGATAGLPAAEAFELLRERA
jgi:N-acetylglucosamine malate deacetylase 1